MKLTGRVLYASLLAATFSSGWAFYTGPATIPRMTHATTAAPTVSAAPTTINTAAKQQSQQSAASATQNTVAKNAPATQNAAKQDNNTQLSANRSSDTPS